MKRYWILLAVITLFSCTSEQEPVCKDNKFRFISNSPQTKVSWDLSEGVSVKWSEGDKVALWGETGTTILGTNCKYKVVPDQTDATKCSFNSVDDVVKYVDGASISIYGYYPFVEGQTDAGSIAISIPPVQRQTEGTAHLSDLCVFKSDPVTVNTSELGDDDVELTFRNVCPVLELGVTLSDSDITVPVKEIKFSSISGASLAYPEATLDLRSNEIEIVPVTESSDILLSVEGTEELENGAETKFYIVLAPGQIVSDDIEVELVAVDHSVATIKLSGNIEIEAGKVYRKDVSVKLEDFIPANPFSIVQNSISGTVGQKVHFDFVGEASTISLYTGMVGCDYNYIHSDRYVRAESMKMSFLMRGDPSGSLKAFNPSCAEISYSYDFDGTLTESAMASAHWTDMSDRFTLPTEINKDTPSGEVDIIPCFPDDKDYIYIRYHYKFNMGTDEIGRTIVYVKNFKISSHHSEFGESTDYDMTNTVWGTILPVDNPAGSKVEISSSQLKFNTSAWKPSADGQAWVVAKIDVHKYNASKDKPLEIKVSEDSMLQGYDVVYDKPGNYEAVFVVKTNTLFGVKEEIIVIPVTIS